MARTKKAAMEQRRAAKKASSSGGFAAVAATAACAPPKHVTLQEAARNAEETCKVMRMLDSGLVQRWFRYWATEQLLLVAAWRVLHAKQKDERVGPLDVAWAKCLEALATPGSPSGPAFAAEGSDWFVRPVPLEGAAADVLSKEVDAASGQLSVVAAQPGTPRETAEKCARDYGLAVLRQRTMRLQVQAAVERYLNARSMLFHIAGLYDAARAGMAGLPVPSVLVSFPARVDHYDFAMESSSVEPATKKK